jgi:hypothetical protein
VFSVDEKEIIQLPVTYKIFFVFFKVGQCNRTKEALRHVSTHEKPRASEDRRAGLMCGRKGENEYPFRLLGKKPRLWLT